MHEINLSDFSLRTDLIIDSNKSDLEVIERYKFSNGEVIKSVAKNKNDQYVTISFFDVTDKDNYNNVEFYFIKELKKIFERLKLKDNDTVLVVGLGNDKSTPDALGPMVVDNVLVTKYLFNLGDVEEGYQNICSFKPDVTGSTGIETVDMIKCVAEVSDAKCLIVIDALAASAVGRLNRVIQITNTGIHPGSGVSNNRGEISYNTIGVPVIAIGVPTIVEADTIVADTFSKIDSFFNEKNSNVLGKISELSKNEFKQLLREISFSDSNLMVTPKEIDFVIEKLGLLIGNGINKTVHKNFIRQNS